VEGTFAVGSQNEAGELRIAFNSKKRPMLFSSRQEALDYASKKNLTNPKVVNLTGYGRK
jgi:hypothetical protein